MRKSLLCLAVVSLLAAVPAAASTFLSMNPNQLVRGSDAVIQGTVSEIESFWSESGRMIYSDATIQVEEVIVGSAPALVKVRTAGGEVGGMLVEAHGFPKFEADMKVIVFLERNGDTYEVVGYQQGHFEVVERLDGVTLAVPMIDEGARYYNRRGRLLPEQKSLEIGDFKVGIRRLATEQGRSLVK